MSTSPFAQTPFERNSGQDNATIPSNNLRAHELSNSTRKYGWGGEGQINDCTVSARNHHMLQSSQSWQTPTPDCRGGRRTASSANGRCNPNGIRGHSTPMRCCSQHHRPIQDLRNDGARRQTVEATHKSGGSLGLGATLAAAQPSAGVRGRTGLRLDRRLIEFVSTDGASIYSGEMDMSRKSRMCRRGGARCGQGQTGARDGEGGQ
jgi:hypothetical protein